MKRECETCIKRKTPYCPTSIDCMATDDMPYYQNRIMLLEENKVLNQKYLNAVADYEEQKFNVEQLKKQKEELRSWLEEQIEFVSNITTFTKEIELSHKQQISIYRYILDKIEELELEGVSNEN